MIRPTEWCVLEILMSRDMNTGAELWTRTQLKDGLYGDPDIYVQGSSKYAYLVSSFPTQTLWSLNPLTGETIWKMDCRNTFSDYGHSCQGSGGVQGGVGAMTVRDGIVYFSPTRHYIMAAQVFVDSPITSPPAAMPPSAAPSAAPSSTPATDRPSTEAPTSSPTSSMAPTTNDNAPTTNAPTIDDNSGDGAVSWLMMGSTTIMVVVVGMMILM
jgi:hypothetical protein